jgi:hypothetical protein
VPTVWTAGRVGVSKMGVADISKFVPNTAGGVSTSTAGPQEAKAKKIRAMGNNKKIPGNVFFTFSSLQFLFMNIITAWEL